MSQPSDPFATPGDGEPTPPASTPVPPYGQQPPSSQPPVYGQVPVYGQQPPAYGQQPPAYGQQPQYGQQPPYGQPQFAPPGAVYPKNSLGVWSLVLSLVGFFLCGFLTSIPGVITGHLSLKANKQGLANNRGLALAGTIIGWVVTALYVVLIIWLVFLGGWDMYMEAFKESAKTT